MINFNSSINKSLHQYFQELRYIGVEDEMFKKYIMMSIIVYNVYYWGVYKDVTQDKQLQMITLLKNVLIHHPKMKIVRDIVISANANVNTPQTNLEWRNLADMEECITIDTV